MRSVVQVVAVLVLLSGPAAWAQVTSRDAERSESPRSGMIELKFGGYKPLIDTEPGLTRQVYRDYFGGGRMLLGELEVERQFWQGFGSVALGVSVGYAEKFGRTRRPDNTEAAEATGLRVVPLRLLAVYRFDWAAQNYGVPLVPYVKLGLVGIPWFVVKGSELDRSGNQSGSGLRYGYQGTAGLALQLDILSQRMARDLDTSLGINHSYFFGEYTYANVDNFGAPGFILSSRGWSFGLGLEY